MSDSTSALRPIGRVHSSLIDPATAPKQGVEAATEALVEILAAFLYGLDGVTTGRDCFILTWLHHADGATLRVHPRDDERIR